MQLPSPLTNTSSEVGGLRLQSFDPIRSGDAALHVATDRSLFADAHRGLLGADLAGTGGVLHPVISSNPSYGVLFYDLGQNAAATCTVTLHHVAATVQLDFQHAEILQQPGANGRQYQILDMSNLRGAVSTDEYIAKGGEANETYTPAFTVHGFRYFTIKGMSARCSRSASPEPSVSVRCAQPLLSCICPSACQLRWRASARCDVLLHPQRDDADRAVHQQRRRSQPDPAQCAGQQQHQRGSIRSLQLCLQLVLIPPPPLCCCLQHLQWGQLSNLMSAPTDCNQRDERRGWMGDAGLSVDEALFNFDFAGFYLSWLYQIALEQGEVSGAATQQLQLDARVLLPNERRLPPEQVTMVAQHPASGVSVPRSFSVPVSPGRQRQ